MKRKIMGLMAILAMAVACQKNESITQETDTTLYATMEEVASTRTMLDDDNNVLWSEGDQIVAFMKTSLGLKYQVTPESVGKTAARFTKISTGNPDDLYAGSELSHNVAYYPYSDIANCMRSGENYEISVILPTEQTYTANSFGNGSLPMVAVSEDNNITFRNVCGGLNLQLKGTQKVTSIKLEGKNGEKLSGAATVTAYTDETKPAITMESGASTSVSLNCGTDVHLNESTATEFIIALPPVLFSKGFTVVVTDADGKTYTVETDKANTVLRSSLLVMPAFKLDAFSGDDSGDEGEDIIPVGKVTVSKTSLTLTTRFSYTLTAKVTPFDATDQSVAWSSDNTSVATVDQSGVVTTLSSGTAVITAEAGGVTCSCTVKVIAPTTREVKDYEVDGVSYGKGIVIGDVIWAPVNCGYEPASGDYKGYPYGKLYQWGRKYGQGNSTSYDATAPEIVEGPISAVNAQKEKYSNTFFSVTASPYDWTSPQDDKLWNSGTESAPVKTEYDPCPTGWRVPTYTELNELSCHYSSLTTVDDQEGYYFSGVYTYLSGAPTVFFPTAGHRTYDGSTAYYRGYHGNWSSSPDGMSAYRLSFSTNSYISMDSFRRALGASVRCVQE